MKKSFFLLTLLFSLFVAALPNKIVAEPLAATTSLHDNGKAQAQDTAQPFADAVEDAHSSAPGWLVIPFILLLLMIATGPLFYEHFWEHNFHRIAVGLALIVVLYYIFILHNVHQPVHSLAEYIQFISLLAALYMASGGILIKVNRKSTPIANVLLLLGGALISNLIGTTGASMLLIRPFIRMNKNRIKPYQIVFFILMVSNIGGSLTPIGDPPLFLGFLKGVPFFWTLEHNWPAWVLALGLLAVVFYWIDKRSAASSAGEVKPAPYSNTVSVVGKRNFFWLLLIILSVFLDPNVLSWVPSINYDGQRISFLRELIMLSVAYLSYRFADPLALKGNDFNLYPIREVAFIFVGIFATMTPALELVGAFARSAEGAALINHNTLYWGTGTLSAVLDNAPTYLNFLAAAMASQGADINNISQVRDFALNHYNQSAFELMAISIASVFFGAMTYIGNGPNFMVKSIAEQNGIKMPSFFGYIIRFTFPILLSILFLVWLVFFAFA
jgi:Na+/H+ antiporter NhaD/arsenite permease-like protein